MVTGGSSTGQERPDPWILVDPQDLQALPPVELEAGSGSLYGRPGAGTPLWGSSADMGVVRTALRAARAQVRAPVQEFPTGISYKNFLQESLTGISAPLAAIAFAQATRNAIRCVTGPAPRNMKIEKIGIESIRWTRR